MNTTDYVNEFINDIVEDAFDIQDFLDNISESNLPLGYYFEPLQPSENIKLLALQKGKLRFNRIRLYAIQIDKNCFVITGGAIKMSQKMQDHPGTNLELKKLFAAKKYLEEKGVFNDDSIFELIKEQS